MARESRSSTPPALARPFVRPAHLHAVGPARGRWCPAPTELERNRRLTDARAWALRWLNPVTQRHNHVLGAADDEPGKIFDAAALYADGLPELRAALISDSIHTRPPWHRGPFMLLLADLLRQGAAMPAGTASSVKPVGDETLLELQRTLSYRDQPGEDTFRSELWLRLPGATLEGMYFFHQVAAALPVLERFEAFARARGLSPPEVVAVLFGFRVTATSSPELEAARAFGCPEARFPTKHEGKVQLCGGVVGALAARLWTCMPVPAAIGPASLYTELLARLGALEEAQAQAARGPEPVPEPALCVFPDFCERVLRHDVTEAEAAANEWFWEQPRRPLPAERALVHRLAARPVVPLTESTARAGVTLREASRRNTPLRPGVQSR